MALSELRVEFCGEEYSAVPGSQLTFGRSADVVIDDNRFLHRVLGEFRSSAGLWWLVNVGSSIALTLHDDASNSFARIAPGSEMPVAFDNGTVRFEAGGTSYELTVDVLVARSDVDEESSDENEAEPGTIDQEMTTTTTSLPLTDEQRELLEALAAPLLAGSDALPTNRHLAHQLGWTITKYNRKLDGLCSKYAKGGVTGLRGSAGELAKDRRLRLAEHVIDAGIVTSPDALDS